jgi:hypothetical protein
MSQTQGSRRDREKRLAKLQYALAILQKKDMSFGEEDNRTTYTQYASGGTRVCNEKLKKASRPKKKFVMHVKVSKTSKGNKDYKVSFSKKKKR